MRLKEFYKLVEESDHLRAMEATESTTYIKATVTGQTRAKIVTDLEGNFWRGYYEGQSLTVKSLARMLDLTKED